MSKEEIEKFWNKVATREKKKGGWSKHIIDSLKKIKTSTETALALLGSFDEAAKKWFIWKPSDSEWKAYQLGEDKTVTANDLYELWVKISYHNKRKALRGK